MDKKIVIKHKNGLAASIFILQNIISLAVFSYIFYVPIMKLFNGEKIESISYFLIAITPFAFIHILKYLKEIYSLKEYIISDSKLIVNQVEYLLEDIELRYIQHGFSTLFTAELFEKENQRVIGRLIINFWGGNILNISSDTLDTIFEKRNFSNIDTDKIQSNTRLTKVDMKQEEQGIKRFDNAWYLVYGVFIIPVALILYLMLGN